MRITRHMHRLGLFGLLLIPPFSLAADTQKLSGIYKTLAGIRSPYEMLSRKLPPRYVAPVTLSGPIADEIATSLASLKINNPRFQESYDANTRFRMELVNGEYSSQVREMLSGILNPAEMTEAILNSVLKYKDIGSLIRLENETKPSVSRNALSKDTVLLAMTLKPSGDRFAYTHTDLGSCISENWLTELTVVLDSARNLVREVSLTKVTNVTGMSDVAGQKTITNRYVFGYVAMGDAPLPARLDFFVNGKSTMTITSTYRQEKGFIVFDHRDMCCILEGGQKSNMATAYGQYRLDASPAPDITGSADYSHKLAEAAKLASNNPNLPCIIPLHN